MRKSIFTGIGSMILFGTLAIMAYNIFSYQNLLNSEFNIPKQKEKLININNEIQKIDISINNYHFIKMSSL